METRSWIFFKIYFTSFKHKTFQIVNESPLLKILFPILILVLLYYYSIIQSAYGIIFTSMTKLGTDQGIERIIQISSSSFVTISVSNFILTYFICTFLNSSYKNNLFTTLGLIPYNSMVKIQTIYVSIFISIIFSLLGEIVIFYDLINTNLQLMMSKFGQDTIILIPYLIIYLIVMFLFFFLIPIIFGQIGGSLSYFFEIVQYYCGSNKYSRLALIINIFMLIFCCTLIFYLNFIVKSWYRINIQNYFIFDLSTYLLASLSKGSNFLGIVLNLFILIFELILIIFVVNTLFKVNKFSRKNSKITIKEKSKNNVILNKFFNRIENKFDYIGSKRSLAQFSTDLRIFLRSNVFIGSFITSIILFFLILIGRIYYKGIISTDIFSLSSILQGLLPTIFLFALLIVGLFSRIWDSGMDSFIFTSSYNFKVYSFVKFSIPFIYPLVVSLFFVGLLNFFSVPYVNYQQSIFPDLILMISLIVLSGFLSSFISPSNSYLDNTNQIFLAVLIFIILSTLLTAMQQFTENIPNYSVIYSLSILALVSCLFLKDSNIV